MGAYFKIIKQIFIAVLILYSASIFASTNQKIQKLLDKFRKEYDIPGISLSVGFPQTNKSDHYVSGYYSLAQYKKITPDTLFQIGSITKTFTATIIYKLIENNKLHMNDTVTKWLPQYPRWKNITIYDLLHHTSGIYNYSSGKVFDKLLKQTPQHDWSLSELANISYSNHDLSNPGQKYNYTNTDYILLGLIIEKVTQKTMQQVYDEYFKKYHLKNTYYLITSNSIAHGYNRDGTFKYNTDVRAVSLSFWQSAGAIISTPDDLIRWLRDLFNGKIITQRSLKDMTTIISEKNLKPININKLNLSNDNFKNQIFYEVGLGAGIGLIYIRNNGLTFVHSGGTPGYESFYAYNPCNGIFIVFTYNIKPKQQLIFINIANEIFKKLNGSPEVVKMIKEYQYKNKIPAYCYKK